MENERNYTEAIENLQDENIRIEQENSQLKKQSRKRNPDSVLSPTSRRTSTDHPGGLSKASPAMNSPLELNDVDGDVAYQVRINSPKSADLNQCAFCSFANRLSLCAWL
jgi:hypothetical protein